MSIRLLEDLDRANTIADELESVFWVLVFIIVKRFIPPRTTFPMEVFYSENFDHLGRRAGGFKKSSSLFSRFHYDFNLRCTPLSQLVKECHTTWRRYQLGIYCPIDSESEADDEPFAKYLKIASDPEYWRQGGSASDDHGAREEVSGQANGPARPPHCWSATAFTPMPTYYLYIYPPLLNRPQFTIKGPLGSFGRGEDK